MAARIRPRAAGRCALASLAAACLLLPAGARAADGPPIAARQQLVALLGVHGIRTAPQLDSEPVGFVGPRRPITGTRTTLPVLDHTKDAQGRSWLRVRLPGRTLGRKRPPRTGWISATHAESVVTAWHIVVDVDARRVVMYHDGRRRRSYRVIVGSPTTPTPRGEYFVEENVRLSKALVGAPFALALSARSNVLQEFAGGPGQIALHGMGNIGGRLGTAASHGCVRLDRKAITWLAAQIRPGVPVTIR